MDRLADARLRDADILLEVSYIFSKVRRPRWTYGHMEDGPTKNCTNKAPTVRSKAQGTIRAFACLVTIVKSYINSFRPSHTATHPSIRGDEMKN